MKTTVKITILAFLFATVSCGENFEVSSIQNNNPAELEEDYGAGFFTADEDLTEDDQMGGETNTDLEEYEMILRKSEIQPQFRFSQTTWDECNEEITGNYLTYNCTRKRGIAEIFKLFLDEYIYQCVDQALAAQGGGVAEELHITHAGIAGDPRHSPRSLHAEQRAIDIKSIQVRLKSGETRTYTYSKTGNRAFYTALRNCWGRTVSQYNECPLYRGTAIYTGSIGWENRAHGYHMHLSIPYCYSGRHGSYYWVR